MRHLSKIVLVATGGILPGILSSKFRLRRIGFFAGVVGVLLAAGTMLSANAQESRDAAHSLADKFADERPTNSEKSAPKKNQNPGSTDTSSVQSRDEIAEKLAEQARQEEQRRIEKSSQGQRRTPGENEPQLTSPGTTVSPSGPSWQDDKTFQFSGPRQSIDAPPVEAFDTNALQRQREAESDALAEKLRLAREAHQAINGQDTQNRLSPGLGYDGLYEPSFETISPRTSRPNDSQITTAPKDTSPDAPEISVQEQTTAKLDTDIQAQDRKPAAAAKEKQVTVLLVMKRGKKGIRRWNKKADPMLCFKKMCYISRGQNKPAERITRKRGFGSRVALGKRAGACRNSLTCVFRGVELAQDGPVMQPIDLRVLRHDRRKARTVKPDTTCEILSGQLVCGVLITEKDWKAWIVPESVAKRAGAKRLKAAVDAGLTSKKTKAQNRRAR